MQLLDWIVLVGYFVLMAVIGVITMLRIKRQEDYFMGGRGFGKLLQTFAAFGAGTGSGDPIATAGGAFVSGLCGMWRIMSWLFATPFYWIIAIWFRRMRHMTTGDFFVERYQSQSLGAAYALFGVGYYIIYCAFLFSAIGAFAESMIAVKSLHMFGTVVPIGTVVIPIIALIVVTYGVLGGLKAAYWTDLIQGMCIILLSVLLIPFGLNALVERYPELAGQNPTIIDGFRVLHERVPESMFTLTGSSFAAEFPLYRIAVTAVILLVGAVVIPHYIAVGGGSAKTENAARFGLVTGNFFKRFCTVAWTITGLIVLALYADNVTLQSDPDQAWGFASKSLFASLPGLAGLMFACLLAALMSSVDCYMLVGSALIVRNLYVPYIDKNATDKRGLLVGRITGVLIIAGSVVMAVVVNDVKSLLFLTFVFPTILAAIFWLGIWWRGATRAAAWGTAVFSLLVFFILPYAIPKLMPDIKTSPKATETSDMVISIQTRKAMATDVARREVEIERHKDLIVDLGIKFTAVVKDGIEVVEEQRINYAAENELNLSEFTYEDMADKLAMESLIQQIKFKSAPGEKSIADIVIASKPKKQFLGAQETTDDSPAMPARIEYLDENKVVLQIANLLKEYVTRREIGLVPEDVVALIGPEPEPLEQGEMFELPPSISGGTGVYWTGGVRPIDEENKPLAVVPLTSVSEPTEPEDGIVETVYRYDDDIRMMGQGNMRFDLWPYTLVGVDLSSQSPAMLATLEMPPRIVIPFLVMILLSLMTKPVDKKALDRFYVKMKTPVLPDPEADLKEMEASYADTSRFDHKKLLPGTKLEIQKPTMVDVVGFVVSFVICFAVIGFAVMLASFKGF